MIPATMIRFRQTRREVEEAVRRDPRHKNFMRGYVIGELFLFLSIVVAGLLHRPIMLVVFIILFLLNSTIGIFVGLSRFYQLASEYESYGGWSAIPPTLPGRYWFCADDDDGLVVLNIRDSATNWPIKGQWLGPIKEPMKPVRNET